MSDTSPHAGCYKFRCDDVDAYGQDIVWQGLDVIPGKERASLQGSHLATCNALRSKASRGTWVSGKLHLVRGVCMHDTESQLRCGVKADTNTIAMAMLHIPAGLMNAAAVTFRPSFECAFEPYISARRACIENSATVTPQAQL